MEEFKRYDKYYVVKVADVNKYLNDEKPLMTRPTFHALLEDIRRGREADGKKSHSYVVVNEDMPYARKVWQLIQEHWEKEEQERGVDKLMKACEKLPKGHFLNP